MSENVELYPGIIQIRSLFGPRNLFQYLFLGERVILVDSGIATTPEKVILPALEKAGKHPARLNMVVTTHPDLDHQGGNAALRMAIPEVLFACGEADREMVQDPRELYRRRYNHLRESDGVGFEAEPSANAGRTCRVDIGFRGGERIAIANNWCLEVLHLPGHSHGHLGLYDPKHKTAFVSDAVHGRGCPKADGRMAIPVTYYYIETYLSTIRQLENLNLTALYTGHWPIMRGEEIADFLSDSRSTVQRLQDRILKALSAHAAGLTLKQLIVEARDEFPEWPEDTQELAMFSIKGHLDLLQASQKIQADERQVPRRWTLYA
jgi:glyoxylase-like metal-dependent hydrolase (beta-lactamase superfamily II)